MAAILPFIKPHDGSFDPDLMRTMGEAFDKACKKLNANYPEFAYEVVAERIIEAARKGERNPDRLSEVGLAEIL